MRDGRRILDADTHQMEPADVWERYIAPEFRPRAPRLQPGGRENLVEGEPLTAEGKYPFHTPDFIAALMKGMQRFVAAREAGRSEEHTSELQSLAYLVCRLLLEKKKN